jgi:hypothetical protein
MLFNLIKKTNKNGNPIDTSIVELNKQISENIELKI